MASIKTVKLLASLKSSRNLLKRCYSPQAAVASKDDGKSGSAIKSNKLKTGLTVASYENDCPVSTIAVGFKAGSRYESADNVGITHCLRVASELSNGGSTSFSLVKDLGHCGATLTVSTTKDFMIYTIQCLREDVEENLGQLATMTSEPLFNLWEMPVITPRLKFEVAQASQNNSLQLYEMLHDAAYHGTSVGRSLYCPADMIGQHTADMLRTYINQHYNTGNMAVVGVGVPQEMLAEVSQIAFQQMSPGSGRVAAPPVYGGGETRKQVSSSQQAQVVVAVEGAGMQDVKQSVALSVLQQHVGNGPRLNYSLPGTAMSPSVAKVAQWPCSVAGVNITHSDTGLFGVQCSGHWKDMDKVVPHLVTQLKDIAKSGLTDKQVEVSKGRLKASCGALLEQSADMMEFLVEQSLVPGVDVAGQSIDEILAAVDDVSTADVNNIAKKVMGGKMSMAAVGNLQATPYLEKLKG